MTLRLLVAHDSSEKEAAQEIEARVFLDAFGNTPDIMAREYDRYADRSRFVTVIDDSNGRAAGAVRLIVPDDTGELKTLTDVADKPWQLPLTHVLRAAGLLGRPVWDVATLAVDPRYRRSEVTLALCHGMFRYPQLSGVHGGVTILDDRVLRMVQAMGVPFVPMAGATSQNYLGSPASTPCVLVVSTVAASIRARRPDLAAPLVDGAFRSIASDPADLLPDRGAPSGEACAESPAEYPPRTARHQAWTPPPYGRSRLGGSSVPATRLTSWDAG